MTVCHIKTFYFYYFIFYFFLLEIMATRLLPAKSIAPYYHCQNWQAGVMFSSDLFACEENKPKGLLLLFFWPRYSIPEEWKKYAMQYKKVQKSIIIIIIIYYATKAAQ